MEWIFPVLFLLIIALAWGTIRMILIWGETPDEEIDEYFNKE